MSDEKRRGRSGDDRDVLVKSMMRRAPGEAQRATSSETDRLGREQQRRATAYARARGQL